MNRSKQRMETFIIHQFAQLLKSHSYKDISVTDVVNAAMIRRNTFYQHFSNKLDLLKKGFRYFMKKNRVGQKEPINILVKHLKQRPFYTLNNFYYGYYPIYFQAQQDDYFFNITIYQIFEQYLVMLTNGQILWLLGRIDAVVNWDIYKNYPFKMISNNYTNVNSDPDKLDQIYQAKKFPKI